MSFSSSPSQKYSEISTEITQTVIAAPMNQDTHVHGGHKGDTDVTQVQGAAPFLYLRTQLRDA